MSNYNRLVEEFRKSGIGVIDKDGEVTIKIGAQQTKKYSREEINSSIIDGKIFARQETLRVLGNVIEVLNEERERISNLQEQS